MTRGKGEGALFKASDGLWTVRIELPRGPDGKRRQKVIRRKDKGAAIAELNRLQIAKLEDPPAPEPMTLEQAVEVILAAIQEQRGKSWRGTSRLRAR